MAPARGSRRAARVCALVACALAVLALDQATKAFMRGYLAEGPRDLVPGVLGLRLVENTGAAFSLGEGAGGLFVAVAVAVVGAAVAWAALDEAMGVPLACALGLVAGGGLGNLVDRVCSGAVTDFLATEFVRFPVFNVADVAITCGVALTLLLWWLSSGDGGEAGGDRA